ncbi:MAG: hypothetical protein KDC48_13480, partial [Planctomycetes bacterium]|nr:hypothetical protein [Planctomycetota bacterium]
MGRFERFLSLWVGLAICVGVLLGRLAPGAVTEVARWEFARINLLVAVLIWVMIYPMMLAIEPRWHPHSLSAKRLRLPRALPDDDAGRATWRELWTDLAWGAW